MTTLSSIRTLVRRDLKDEDSANYRWTDDEIDRAIEKAVLEYSEYCPLQVKTVVTTSAGSQDVSIAALSERIDVMQAEHPVGQVPKQCRRFKVWGDVLSFQDGYTGDGANCNIYWLKKHSIGASDSTIPAAHEHVIALGAAAFAVSSQGQYSTNMANTGGADVDRDYGQWAQAMFDHFYAALERIRSYNHERLKSSTMEVSDE